MPLNNCELELILDWSANLYVPVVTLSTQDNFKLLPHLQNGFKRTVSWNK